MNIFKNCIFLEWAHSIQIIIPCRSKVEAMASTSELTRVKLNLCMKCLPTSLAAAPNMQAAMSCQGILGSIDLSRSSEKAEGKK